MAKQKLPTLVSPPGTVKFAHVTKPNTKFKKEGEFSIDLTFDPNDANAQKFFEQLDAASNAAKTQLTAEKAKVGKYALHSSHRADEDKDGNETGLTLVRFKNGATGKNKAGETFNVSIAIVDAKKNPLKAPKIGTGSVVKVAFQAVPFANDATKQIGVTLRLKAVQVLKLVEYGNDAASAFGEEEGFTADDDFGGDEQTTTSTGNTEGSGDGDF